MNSDKKPGQAAADRAREQTQYARDRMRGVAKQAFPEFSEETHPRIPRPQIKSIATTDSSPPSIPVLRHVPRPWRKYVVGAVIGLLLAGGLKADDLLRQLGILRDRPPGAATQ